MIETSVIIKGDAFPLGVGEVNITFTDPTGFRAFFKAEFGSKYNFALPPEEYTVQVENSPSGDTLLTLTGVELVKGTVYTFEELTRQ